MVRSRGGNQHVEWSGRFDGRDYPVQGVGYVLTNAYRQLSERSYEIVVKVDDRAAAVATAKVSPDGRTLDVETKERDAKGRTVTTTATYRRR
jgi:glutamate dehydrogenase/leucine dehydrogenase